MVTTSRGTFLAGDELGAWHGLLETQARLVRELDRRLRADHGLGVSAFDVLITLFNADEQRLRMTDLANAIVLSPAGLTHLATRLERDGLVERGVDPSDRRSFLLKLTAAGQVALDSARITHNEVVRTALTGRLSPAQLRQLAQIWADLRP